MNVYMNTWDFSPGYQDFSQYPHTERVNFEQRFAILRRRKFCDIGIFLIIRLKTIEDDSTGLYESKPSL